MRFMGHHQENQNEIMGVSEREEKEKGEESLFKEIKAENFPNLGREVDREIDSWCPNDTIQGELKKGLHQDTLQLNGQKSKTRRILKTAIENELITYMGPPFDIQQIYQQKT